MYKDEPLKETSVDLASLDEFARELVSLLGPGSWLFLDGELGAGKTALSGAILRAVGANDVATSPTFSILNVYPTPSASKYSRVLHLDLYRIKNGGELCYLGLEENFNQKALAVFEWPSLVDASAWQAFFETTGCQVPSAIYLLQIEGSGNAPRRMVLSQVS